MNIEVKGIKISPKYYQQDWNQLKLDTLDIKVWDKALNIFRDRMEGRFIKQIEVLDLNRNREIGLYSGYAIMPLICLFIETIEQFWTGNIETKRYRNNKSKIWISRFFRKRNNHKISNDSKAFFSFFQRSVELKNFFDSEEKADVFYRKIRCGLLHQGQTKGKSLIHIRNSEPMLKWVNDDNINDGISINRRKFFNEILSIYESYLIEVTNGDLNFKRKTLKKKMDYIVAQK